MLPLLAGASLLLNACAAQQPEVKHPTYSSADVATAEYRAEAAGLTLAPDWTWPQEPIPSTYQGDEVRYEKGYGKQAADQYWFCSWAVRAVEGRPGSRQRAEAVRQLQTLTSKYYFEVLNPQSRPYALKELQTAREGDLGLVQRDIEQNCPKRS
ncbi:MAG TPA: hypothetical protein VGJ44_10050 [Kribbellaceae bacterium]|jgi:hypothetical protein